MQPAYALRRFRIAGALAVFVVLCGCARLPPTGAVSIPPIPAGAARVWFYREDAPYISQARPYVRMNGAVVGISEDGGAFYRDVPPGQYYVTADSYGVIRNEFGATIENDYVINIEPGGRLINYGTITGSGTIYYL